MGDPVFADPRGVEIDGMMKGLPNFTDLMIAWARRRLASAPQLVELERKSGEHREDDES
jgi:hypothetical protein